MSSEIEHLQLEATDSVVAVRQRFSGLRGRRVLLIWSPDVRLLTRKLDLVLIQRDAYRRAIQLALVAQDKRIIAQAAELNISCFPSVEASETARWNRGRQKRFLPRYHKPSADLLPEDLALIAARLENRQRHSPCRSAVERSLVLILLIAVIGAALYIVLPSAVVDITLAREDVIAVVDIVADRKANAVNLERGLIPARSLMQTIETTATIPASGTFWLDSVSAAGVATFTNLSGARVIIPAKTILGTSAGEPILFETIADILVPAGVGRSVDATVEAREGYRGNIGNVGAGMINTIFGALSERVSVINLAPFAGGGVRSVKVVAAEDQARLLESVRIQLQSLAFEQMRSTLSDSQVMIIESIRIEEERKEWTRFSADIGTMTSELSLTMRAVVSAIAIDDRYGRQVALGRLRAMLPAGKDLLAGSEEYSRGPFALGPADGQVRFTATARASAVAGLDASTLRATLAGISVNDAKSLLLAGPEISAADPPVLTLYPKGLERMPALPIRIELRFNQQA